VWQRWYRAQLTTQASEQCGEVATSTGAELFVFQADGPDDYPAAFAAMRSAGAEALAITATPYFYRDAPLLARLPLEAGLPTVWNSP